MDLISYTLLRCGLFLFFLLITSPILVGLGLLAEFLNKHDSLYEFRWVLIFPYLAVLFASGWTATVTANYITFKNQPFGKAVKLSLNEARLRLSFLPLVGHWFTPKGEDHE